MKKQLLTAVCGLFLSVGAANAQIVVRIGPRLRAPSKSSPRRPTQALSGFRATTAGMATAMSGYTVTTPAHPIAEASGSKASGVKSAAVTSGTPATGSKYQVSIARAGPRIGIRGPAELWAQAIIDG